MPRACSLCAHPQRTNIEAAINGGAAFRDVAGQFGLSKSAVARHAADHLPPAREDEAAAEVLLAAAESGLVRIHVTQTMRASPDGIRLRLYEAGRDYAMPPDLARTFLQEGWGWPVWQPITAAPAASPPNRLPAGYRAVPPPGGFMRGI